MGHLLAVMGLGLLIFTCLLMATVDVMVWWGGRPAARPPRHRSAQGRPHGAPSPSQDAGDPLQAP